MSEGDKVKNSELLRQKFATFEDSVSAFVRKNKASKHK